MGPMNAYLKTYGASQVFSEEMAERVVSRFGSNFADLGSFVSEVLEKRAFDEAGFLIHTVNRYKRRFDVIWKNASARAILDDLLKIDSFDLSSPYEGLVLDDLAQKDIIAQHAGRYSWNKRIIRIAYEEYVRKRKK